MRDEMRMPLNLQFFAEDGEGEPDEGASTGNQDPETPEQEGNPGEKTFTQAEVSAMATAEKKQGKQSILNIFGVKDEKAAREQAKAFKEWQDTQKTAEAKVKEQEELINEANLRAVQAENKLICIELGVNKDSVDDVMAIAASKVTEDVDLKSVLEEMKKESKYKGFFEATSGSSAGTGTPAGHQGTGGTGGAGENLGARLGKAKNKEKPKSNFFVN